MGCDGRGTRAPHRPRHGPQRRRRSSSSSLSLRRRQRLSRTTLPVAARSPSLARCRLPARCASLPGTLVRVALHAVDSCMCVLRPALPRPPGGCASRLWWIIGKTDWWCCAGLAHHAVAWSRRTADSALLLHPLRLLTLLSMRWRRPAFACMVCLSALDH